MSAPAGSYDFRDIEPRWQKYWLENKTFRTPNPGEPDFDARKAKFYVLDMFPYPSGVGLHVGHPLGYIATDIFARFKRMRGYNVLHPMGYDAFGLPAEQYAVEHGVPPRETTLRNIANIRTQMQRLGLGYDWDREIATTDVGYYRWTQWIFLQLYTSWYDPAADAARPITELIHELEQEHLVINFDGQAVPVQVQGQQEIYGLPAGTQRWSDLTSEQRRAVLDNHRLAYLDEVPVNWCPALGTVLANEEVTNEGRSERGNYPVYRRPLRQWMLRITKYADRLERDLEGVDWPDPIKLMQRNWIGRSEGAEVDFAVEGSEEVIRVYTTRPDTLFGATYMVLAPEHELVAALTTEEHRTEVQRYVEIARNRSDLERTAESREKTGVFIGAYAINPVNGERIPIWAADYVLMGYGTGAIMAVPAHDTRDFDFAQNFHLPVIQVVEPPAGLDWHGFVGDGVAVNSGEFNGLPTPEFKKRITAWLEEKGIGTARVNYKLRDWLFSRQRYWGEPFPIVHDIETGETFALDESELPVVLPEIDDFRPQASNDPDVPPAPPLGRAREWANVRGYVDENGYVRTLLPDEMTPEGVVLPYASGRGGREIRSFRRELNTMPQWAGSCWYFLRYLDPLNEDSFVDTAREHYWMVPASADGTIRPGGIDLYVGGAEHAVLHLLYARFWHKVLHDLGFVSTPEPFARLVNQGYIQEDAFQDEREVYVDAFKVVDAQGRLAFDLDRREREGTDFFFEGKPVKRVYGKMGKSLKNASTPDDICAEQGADTLRVYEMYMGPLEASKPWSTRDIIGMSRFLNAVWRRFVAEDGSLKITDDVLDETLRRLLHKTVKRVTGDMEGLRFNTAIAGLIEFNNALKVERIPRESGVVFLKLLAPIAPHLCEELWKRLLGDKWQRSIAFEPWPTYDEALAVDLEIEIPVQINGKLRSRLRLPAGDAADLDRMRAAALADPKIQQELNGMTIRKVICVPGRLVNVVATA